MFFRTLVITALTAGAAFAVPPSFSCGSIVEYRKSLQVLDAALANKGVRPADFVSSLPASCDIDTGQAKVQVSTEYLTSQLKELAAETNLNEIESHVSKLHAYITRELANLDAFSQNPDPTARPKLTAILSRKEFSHVRYEDTAAKAMEWIKELVISLLIRLLGNANQAAEFATAAVWVFCALIVALALFWGWKWWAGRARSTPLQREIMPFAPSGINWRQWMADAEIAFRLGDFRHAVHLAYWAAISKLEASGAWRPDRARTPREYIAFLPRSSAWRPRLVDITHSFEVSWYGKRQPSAAECEDFLAKVTSL